MSDTDPNARRPRRVADTHAEYTDEEWEADRPLKDVDVNEVVLLHRHWIWANLQRHRFEALLPGSKSPDEDKGFLASGWCCWMFLGYALLWRVIDGFDRRKLEYPGPMAGDVKKIS